MCSSVLQVILVPMTSAPDADSTFSEQETTMFRSITACLTVLTLGVGLVAAMPVVASASSSLDLTAHVGTAHTPSTGSTELDLYPHTPATLQVFHSFALRAGYAITVRRNGSLAWRSTVCSGSYCYAAADADGGAYTARYAPTGSTSGGQLSGPVVVDVGNWPLLLTVSANTVDVGSSVTVTATTQGVIAGSPYQVEIIEDTNGTLLTHCAAQSCSTSVAQTAAVTIRFHAEVKQVLVPPGGDLGTQAYAQPEFVTWSVHPGWTISLTMPANSLSLVATTNHDVGPTPYYILFYNWSTGHIVQPVCGTGTQCVLQLSTNVSYTLIAFVDSAPATYLPQTGAVANSEQETFTLATVPPPPAAISNPPRAARRSAS